MKTITLFCFGLLTAVAMQAQVIHVPGDYQTIQQGINAANPGDTVLVAEGTYEEQINFLGKKPLIVASQFLIDGDTTHIGRTVVTKASFSNMDSASIVYFVSGEDTTSVLCGFTITGGRGTNVSNSLWKDREGGGIWISGSGAAIRNNIITKNRCEGSSFSEGKGTAGGGIAIAYEQEDHWVVIENNLIDSNWITSGVDTNWNDGGGIWAGNNCRIISNIISNNLAKNLVNTTGIYYSDGAGICAYADTSWNKQVFIENNLIQGNSVRNNYSWGGGLVVSGTYLFCSNNTIRSNRAESDLIISNLGGGGMGVSFLKEGSVIRNTIFEGNTSESWSGGLNISPGATTTLLVENNFFIGNHANGSGGAMGVADCPVLFQNNLFLDNDAHNDGVGYLEYSNVQTEHTIFFINNTFVHNRAVDLCGSLDASAAYPLIMNCIFWEDTAYSPNELWAHNGGQFEIAYSDIDTNETGGNRVIGPGVFHADPVFEDLENLVPSHWSPCIDKGVGEFSCSHGCVTHAPAYDLTGTPRPVGAGYDLGAYDRWAWGFGVGRVEDGGLRISAYPNPFTVSTMFRFTLPLQAKTVLKIFNSAGQIVAEPINSTQEKGDHQLKWDAGNLPAGIYHYSIESGNIKNGGKVLKL
jgi:hypothetical protein